MRKELSHVRMKPSNVKKSKGITKCEKITVTYDVGTTQCEDETVKCEKKNKRTTKCEKRIVTCNVNTAQCENRTVKCEKNVREPPNLTKELSHVTKTKQMRYWYCLI